MKKALLILLLSLTMNGYAQSYQKQLDSLEKKIKKLSVERPSFHRDTLMVIYLVQKSTAEISSVNSEIGISTAKEALKLSENSNWNKGILLSLFGLAQGEEVKSRYFTCIKYCLRILSVIDKKEFPYLYTNTLQLVAGSYMWMEKPKESLLYFNQLFKEITPQNISKSRLGDAYTGMGILHIKYLKNPQVAYQYLVKAGKDYAAIKDTFVIFGGIIKGIGQNIFGI